MNHRCCTAICHTRYLAGLLTLLLVLPTGANASNFHIPQPWRTDAAVHGRDEAYDAERFLHELTFRHLHHEPSPAEDGIRGTGGSVSSRRLYYDFRFARDFEFHNETTGFLLDIQRGEDLDGVYDRQLVGFRQNLTSSTEVWLQGDVYSDKSFSDIYLSTRHYLGQQSWLHASWVLPDYYFNEKTETSDRFEDAPQSFFLQWHRGEPDRFDGTTVSATLSPTARFDSKQHDLTVSQKAVRLAATHRRATANWQLTLETTGELTRREYQLRSGDIGGEPDFRRDYFRVRAEAQNTLRRFSPAVGVSYLYLDEEGYFGRALNDTGSIQRREPTLYGDLSISVGARTTLSPAIYLSLPDIEQSFTRHRDRDQQEFTGKLALPFEFLVSAEDQAYVTLNPTFYLHKPAFGGGNLQFHWPL